MSHIMKWFEQEKHREQVLFGMLGLFMLLKFIYYGLSYFPVLDDWIQYGTYPMHEDPFTSVILRAKTYSSRPLAAFFDPYVWGRFWNHMWVVLFTLTGLHWLSMVMLYKVMKLNGLKIGWLALLIYGGLPLGAEATYWISASSRLVFALFLAVWSWYILMVYIQSEKGKRANILLIGYSFVSLMSLAFYEQIIPISIIASGLILWHQRERLRVKWVHCIPWVNLVLIGGYYAVFMSHSSSASRSSISLSMIPERMGAIIRTIRVIFSRNQEIMYRLDIRRGLDIIIIDRAYGFVLGVALLVLGILLWHVKSEHKLQYRVEGVKIALGFVFFVLPYTPFLILAAGGWDMRNAFPSMLGLGLIIDGLIGLIPDHISTRVFRAMVVSGIAVIFILVHVSIVTFYKEASDRDFATGTEIIEIAEGSGVIEGTTRLMMFNPEITYSNGNYLYGSSIGNATGSDWAMTGLLRALTQNLTLPSVYHVPDGSLLSQEHSEIEAYVLVGIDKLGNVVELDYYKVDSAFVLVTSEGEFFGQLEWSEEGYIYTREPKEIVAKEEVSLEEVTEDVEVADIEEEVEIEVEEEVFQPVFEVVEIDSTHQILMEGRSFHKNKYIGYEDLRIVNVTYYGFDGQPYQGEIIVNQVIAEDMKEIFEELYEAKYPIEKIRLVDYYEGDDDLSMVDNNTSAFNYRVIAGTAKLSNHAYGLAIDINPLINPYVTSYGIFPPEGAVYADRTIDQQGMILSGDVCYEAFTSRGFIWGGDWSKSKDYQHFDIWIEGINK